MVIEAKKLVARGGTRASRRALVWDVMKLHLMRTQLRYKLAAQVFFHMDRREAVHLLLSHAPAGSPQATRQKAR